MEGGDCLVVSCPDKVRRYWIPKKWNASEVPKRHLLLLAHRRKSKKTKSCQLSKCQSLPDARKIKITLKLWCSAFIRLLLHNHVFVTRCFGMEKVVNSSAAGARAGPKKREVRSSRFFGRFAFASHFNLACWRQRRQTRKAVGIKRPSHKKLGLTAKSSGCHHERWQHKQWNHVQQRWNEPGYRSSCRKGQARSEGI